MTRHEFESMKQRLETWSAEYRDHPLLAELAAMVAQYEKLEQRLNKVANISDRLQGEMMRLNEALRGSEARYRLLTDNTSDVLWNLDLAQERLVHVSPSIERLTGYTVEEALAQSIEASLTPASAKKIREVFDHLKHHGKLPRPSLELERRCKGGGTVWTEDLFTVTGTKEGRPASVISVSRDISVRRAAEQEQQRFFAMVSHEFRTPLATIDGAIQRLEAADGIDAATRKRYDNIQNAVSRLTLLLDDYLNQDRMDTAARGLHLAPVTPRALLEDSAVSVRALSTEHHIVIDDAALPDSVVCDPDLMRLTLRALADNAAKYTAAGSTIRLSCRRVAEGGVELLVADDGQGIPADELPHVFDKFFRGRSTGNKTGTGLGLHLAQSVVEAHGGTLTVRNLPAGGAEFRIWLPSEAVRIG